MTQAYQEKVKEFCDKLRQKRVVGSYAAAKGTVEILKQLVSSTKAENAQMLLEEVRSVGVRIQSAKPVGTCHVVIWSIPGADVFTML